MNTMKSKIMILNYLCLGVMGIGLGALIGAAVNSRWTPDTVGLGFGVMSFGVGGLAFGISKISDERLKAISNMQFYEKIAIIQNYITDFDKPNDKANFDKDYANKIFYDVTAAKQLSQWVSPKIKENLNIEIQHLLDIIPAEPEYENLKNRLAEAKGVELKMKDAQIEKATEQAIEKTVVKTTEEPKVEPPYPKDFTIAVITVSTVLIALTPVFLAFKPSNNPSLIAMSVILLISWVLGFFVVTAGLDWLRNKENRPDNKQKTPRMLIWLKHKDDKVFWLFLWQMTTFFFASAIIFINALFKIT